jgi:hypothetical protein
MSIESRVAHSVMVDRDEASLIATDAAGRQHARLKSFPPIDPHH